MKKNKPANILQEDHNPGEVATSIEELMARERWATEESLIRGNENALDEVFAPGCVCHNPPLLPSYTLEEMKLIELSLRHGLTDIRWSWDKVVIEGNTAIQRYTVHAKHTGRLPHIPLPPTGKELVWSGYTVYRVENGKIIECFEHVDNQGFLQQLGLVPVDR